MRTWLLQAGSNRYFTHNTYSQAVQLLPTCSHPESGHPRVNLTLTGLQKDLSISGQPSVLSLHKRYPPSAFDPIFPKHSRSCDLTPGSSRKRLGRHFKVGGRPPPACQGQPGQYLSYLNDISVAPPITLPTVHKGYPPSAFEPSFPKQHRSCDSAQGSSRKRLGGVIAVLEVILYLGFGNVHVVVWAWRKWPHAVFGRQLDAAMCLRSGRPL